MLHWLRNDGKKLDDTALAVGPMPEGVKALVGFVLSDLAGDALPDLLIACRRRRPPTARQEPRQRPALAGARSRRALEDELRPHADQLRTAWARSSRWKGRGSRSPTTTRPRRPGLGQSIGPVVLGLDRARRSSWFASRWPDGTMQCELNAKADAKLAAQRDQSQDGQLPGTFHVERLAVRVPGRLPRRRRPGLSGRSRRLRPARS